LKAKQGCAGVGIVRTLTGESIESSFKRGVCTMKTLMLVCASLWLAAGTVAHADEATCANILAANVATGSKGVHMKTSGYDFAGDTPRLYGTGEHSCTHLRDETVDGQAAEVYREQYKAGADSTDATIWVSKSSGHLLREEQDGDIKGKGKGHISYIWSAKP